jgi:hypothetical protein
VGLFFIVRGVPVIEVASSDQKLFFRAGREVHSMTWNPTMLRNTAERSADPPPHDTADAWQGRSRRVDVTVPPCRKTPSLIVASLSSTVKKSGPRRATRLNLMLETVNESDEPPLHVTDRGNHSHHLTWVARPRGHMDQSSTEMV